MRFRTKSIRVLGYKVNVQCEKEPKVNGEEVSGYYDDLNNRVGLNACLDVKHTFSTLLHELFEAINIKLALDLKHDEQLHKLESGLFQVMIDNPDYFIEWLKRIKKS